MRIMIALAALLLVAAIAVGAQNGGTSATGTPSPTPGRVYAPDVLARASSMTQQMSADAPITGHEYHGHAGDEQLRLSIDSEFVRELEAYQRQVDRMLARTP